MQHGRQKRRVDRRHLQEQADATAAQSQPLVNSRAVNAERRGERALKVWNTWASASVMKSVSSACRSPEPRAVPTQADPKRQQPTPLSRNPCQ